MCLQNCKATLNDDLNDKHERVELQYWNVSDKFLGNCDYVDTENCKNIKIGTNDLSILQLNIRGLISKQQDLKYLLSKCTTEGKIDIVILVETWLTQESTSRISMPGYSYVGKSRKTKKGGGVGLLIRNEIAFKSRIDLEWESDIFESYFIEIKGRCNTILGALYRPPNTSAKEFVEQYGKFALKLKQLKINSFAIGMDHNLDLLKHNSYSHTQTLLETMAENNHFPCIMRPTRITSKSATLIDNIVVSSDIHANQECSIVVNDISDHFPCLMKIPNYIKTRLRCTEQRRHFSTKKVEELKHRLDNVNWHELLSDTGTETSMNLFHSELMKHLDDVCPEKSILVSTNHNIREAWMTPGLLKCATKQLRLYKNFITKKDTVSEVRYKEYRDVFKHMKRNCRCAFYLHKCVEFKNNSKKMWQLINSVIGKNNDKCCVVTELTINNLKTTSSDQIVNGLAEHFAGVGSNFASNIKPSKIKVSEYNSKIKQNSKSILLGPTNEYEIAKILDNLGAKQSSGWDGITNKLLKDLKTSLVQPLTIVFNQSISEGIFPSIMKTAMVTPLYKSGSRDLNTNYRPISLLMTISKILEKLLYIRTYNFLIQTNQIYQSQYGFRKKHSCEHAIQELVGTVLKGFENNEYTCAIFLDLSKAFDSLEHHVLLDKLDLYGIRGIAQSWYKSYLSDRCLRVKCFAGATEQQTVSKEFDVTYGVPQGSILGPLLFLIFCNDLAQNLETCKGILFADDTTIYKKHSNINYLMWSMSEELKRLMD